MKLFKNILKRTEPKKKKTLPWIPLNKNEQLKEIVGLSNSKPVLVFKHSTRCGISKFVLKNFELAYDIDSEKMDIYYLDLLNYRQISNDIAEKFDVYHQSPQVLVIDKGNVVYHNSHQEISVENIKKAIG